MSYDQILQLADNYNKLIKLSYIKKMPNGKYRVFSQKGKNLGTYDSKALAEKRLSQIEFFKHKDENNINDKVIDLMGADDFSFSAIMRELRQKADKDQVKTFLKLFKIQFDKAVKNKLQKPEKVALQNSLIKFNKLHKIKVNKKLTKNAAIIELSDSILIGEYFKDIARCIRAEQILPFIKKTLLNHDSEYIQEIIVNMEFR